MLEILAAGVIGAVGHQKTKDFVRRRLRFTGLIEKPGLGLFSGAATFIVTATAITLLPLVGAGVGIAMGVGAGVGVGTGVAIGASQARKGWQADDE